MASSRTPFALQQFQSAVLTAITCLCNYSKTVTMATGSPAWAQALRSIYCCDAEGAGMDEEEPSAARTLSISDVPREELQIHQGQCKGPGGKRGLLETSQLRL